MPSRNLKEELRKPEHRYPVSADALDPGYRQRMEQVKYEDYVQHPENIPVPAVGGSSREAMPETAENMRILHYLTAMEYFGLDGRNKPLNEMMRKCRSFEEVKQAFDADPDRYCKGKNKENTAEHLAEIYDAVTRDSECAAVAEHCVQEMLQKRPAPAKAQNRELHAGARTDVYLQRAEEVMNDDPAVMNAYAGFRRAMKELTDYTASLSAPGKNGKLPVLDAKVMRRLEQKYHTAEERGVNLLLISAAKEEKTGLPFRNSVQSVLNLLAKDRKIFAGFDPERRLTFPQMLNAVHSEFIDADRMKNTLVKSHQMSQRIAMSLQITDADGRERYAKGLFTAEEHSTGYPALEMILKKYKLTKDTADQERTIAERNLAALVNDFGIITPERLASSIGDMEAYRDDEGKMHFRWENEKNAVPALTFWMHERLESCDEASKELFEQFRAELSGAAGKIRTNYAAGIPEKSRIDQRNSAMSAVAKLLGKDNLICRSRPMMMKKDGKLVKGTFMEFSELTDPQDYEMQFENVNNRSFDNPQFVRDASDLQVLDFICGNIDRHGGNMFYRIKTITETKEVLENNEKKIKQDIRKVVTGLQGIDNDLSFGVIDDDVLRGDEYLTNFKGLDHMRVITQQTAQIIRRMTPEMLKAALSPYGLSNAETEAACHRLDLLQKALDDTYVKNPQKFDEEFKAVTGNVKETLFRKGKLYVLNDAQLEKVSVFAHYLLGGMEQRDGKSKPVNHFAAAVYTTTNISKKIAAARAFKEPIPQIEKPDLPESSLAYNRPAVRLDAGKLADRLQQQIEELEQKNKGAFISSTEYGNVLNYAKILQKQLNGMRNQPLTAEKQSLIRTMMENQYYLNQAYMDKKDREGSRQKSTTAENRYQTVRSLQDLMENMMQKYQLDMRSDYCRLSAIQRAGAFIDADESRSIAENIRLLDSSSDQLLVCNTNIRRLFMDVADLAYHRTFGEYRDLLHNCSQVGADAQRVPEQEHSPEGILNQQTQEVLHVLNDNGTTAQGFRQVQESLSVLRKQILDRNGYLDQMQTKLNQRPQITRTDAENIIHAYELVHLADAAGRNTALLRSEFRERLAERMTALHLRRNPQELKNPRQYERVYQNYLNSAVLCTMTAGKSMDQMQKMVSAPEADLLKHWNHAQQRNQKLQKQIPPEEIRALNHE